MSDLLQAVKGTALSVAEYFTPVLKQSKFKQTGVLTPDEFVMAGDHLVHHCPTWSWSSAPDPTYQRPYLPQDKQYLVTKSVPCYKRCKNIEYCSSDEKIILDNDGDGGWVDTHHSSIAANVSEMVNEMTINDLDGDNQSKTRSLASRICPPANTSKEPEHNKDEDDGEAEDMDQFLNMVDEEDNAVADIRQAHETHPALQSSQESSSDNQLGKEEGDNTVPTRTYDLNITYDKYYQTPRLWLVGYDENHKPLTINEMYEDISQDHAKKTVTMETHPHIPTVMASVHPCRHAEVMKKIISTVEDGGRDLQVYSYLIVFLKFVQSVIPTIEYDYTQNFTM